MRILKRTVFFSLLSILSITYSQAQSDEAELQLDSVIINAFEHKKKLLAVPASVQYISKTDIERFDNQNVSQVLNQYPGVRIEERSPGSYRIAIRGSSLRSPFGVRNVKVYWEDIPLTDATGTTYFNLQDINTLSSIEVIKGPSGSMYGAGIGGVLLLKPKTAEVQNQNRNEIQVNTLFGSYGTFNSSLALRNANDKINSSISYNRVGTQGYRDHSQFKRESFQWQSSFFLKPNYSISIITQMTDLGYQTPLGLTQELALEQPQQARPGNSFVPGAEEQEAGIQQKLINLGLTQKWQVSRNFETSLSFFGNISKLQNPFITNYEERDQQTLGSRLSNTWRINNKGNALHFGTEWQRTLSTFSIFDNNKGSKGEWRSDERVTSGQGILFIQSENPLPFETLLSIGLSYNIQNYDYSLFTPQKTEASIDFIGKNTAPFVPRIGLSKGIGHSNIYASFSRGFSPPTVAEVIDSFDPLVSSISPLSAETANNLEAGLKSQWWSSRAFTEISYYRQNLKNAIVRSFNAQEDQIFTNEGSLSQQGLEAYGKVNLNKFLKFSTALTWTRYTFVNYIDLSESFSGNRVPSAPQFQGNLALDAISEKGLFLNTNSTYTSAIYLNNANTVASTPFWLINIRGGFKKEYPNFRLKTFFGINNLSNSFYGSGNDSNAFGQRYFNPSPPRNYNVGIDLAVHF